MGDDNYLVEKFKKLENAFLIGCPEGDLEDFRVHMMLHCLKIWAEEGLCRGEHADALNAVLGKSYTVEKYQKFMDQVAVLNLMPCAKAYASMVKSGIESGRPDIRQFLDDLGGFLKDMASVDGDCTERERRAVLQTKYCYADFYQAALEFLLECAEKNDFSRAFTYARNGYQVVLNFMIKGDDASANKEPQSEPLIEEEAAPMTFDTPEEKPLGRLLEELDSLIGLDAVKQDIRSMINFIKMCSLRKERGFAAPELSYHLVFSGNPGTGKTTVARLLAQIYKEMGILKTGHLVEVDRSDLIAGYLGQTAIKTQEVIQSALGGVLFIDEAYSLAGSGEDSFGKECIATLLKAMEDHRDELIIIVAGYDDLMHQFMDANPGLKSRFNKYFNFPDYTGAELEHIFQSQCDKNGYKLEPAAKTLLREHFEHLYATRDDSFGNGRAVRNLFEKIINKQADRLVEDPEITDDELITIVAADVAGVIG